jgi:lysozyme
MANRAKLSAAMLSLIAAGASAPVLFDQFISEKEGNALVAVVDPGGVWSLCHGVTVINGKPVIKGQRATEEQCKKVNAVERDKALAWVQKNIHVPLTEPQKVALPRSALTTSAPKCFPSTFYQRINAGDRKGACEAIRWWIKDGGKDCRVRSNNCYGQIERRDQESALACWGIDQ